MQKLSYHLQVVLWVNGNMVKEEIAPGILVHNDVIPNEIFNTLLTDIEEGMTSARLEWTAAHVQEGQNPDSTLNTKTRDTSTISVPYSPIPLNNYDDLVSSFHTSLSNIFLEHLVPLEKNYQNQYGVNCSWHDSYQILKYGVGQKFVNHIDDHTDHHRRISTLYYLNDNYSGGQIIFPRFGISFKPKPNQMVIFPSNFVYNHSVLPVTEGVRYAVVSWLR